MISNFKKSHRKFSLLAVGVMFTLCILFLTNAYKDDGIYAMNQNKFPEVLLKNAVQEFEYIANHVASHTVVLDDDVYPQPCVYLTSHLVCIKAAG